MIRITDKEVNKNKLKRKTEQRIKHKLNQMILKTQQQRVNKIRKKVV